MLPIYNSNHVQSETDESDQREIYIGIKKLDLLVNHLEYYTLALHKCYKQTKIWEFPIIYRFCYTNSVNYPRTKDDIKYQGKTKIMESTSTSYFPH